MPKYNFFISRPVDIIARKLTGMNPETISYVTQILSNEAQRISKEFQYNGQNINPDILTARLDGLVNQIEYEYHTKINHRDDKNDTNTYPISEQKIEPITTKSTASSYSICSQQPNIDWYFIKPYATYYQDATTHILHSSPTIDDLNSPSTSDSEVYYSKPQKIVVNVINDNPSLINSPKPILKSNNNQIKKTYTSPNTIIGSRTMEDIFQVVNNRKSTSMAEHVIIIDRPHSNSSSNTNQTKQLQTFQIHTSTPITTGTISIAPSTGYTVQQPTYYNYQQPERYTSMANNIYLTTTSYVAAHANSFYPFLYYQY